MYTYQKGTKQIKHIPLFQVLAAAALVAQTSFVLDSSQKNDRNEGTSQSHEISLEKGCHESLEKGQERNLEKGCPECKQLEKVGSAELKDKIQKAAEEHSEEEDLAQALVASMTPGKKSNAWNQHQVHLKKERQ